MSDGRHSASNGREAVEKATGALLGTARASGASKVARAAMLLALVVCIAVPLAFMERGHEVESDLDNRLLVEMPVWGESEAYAAEVEQYFTDRIGFRRAFTGSFARINAVAFNIMTSPLYDYGIDGYTFHAFKEPDLDPTYYAGYAMFVRRLQTYCEERGVLFLYVISPEKKVVYADKIPGYIPEQTVSTELLIPLFDELGVNYLDLAPVEIAVREAGVQVFNVDYDPGHWNADGSLAASQAIIARLNEMGVEVEPVDLDDYDVYVEHKGTQPSGYYSISFDMPRYLAKEGEGAVLLGGFDDEIRMDYRGHFWYWANWQLTDAPRLLMFQGSYFNSQGTTLYNQFNEAMLVHDYVNVFDAYYYFDIMQPDVVIFESADYATTPDYYSRRRCYEAQLPPAFASWGDVPVEYLGEGAVVCERSSYNPEGAIAQYWLDWNGSVPVAAYALVNGTYYDMYVSVADDGVALFWACDVARLVGEDVQVDVYCVVDDGSSMEHAAFMLSPEFEDEVTENAGEAL